MSKMFGNRLNNRIRTNYFIRVQNFHNNHRVNDFPITYESQNIEDWYKLWETNKFFQPPENNVNTFRMILPPPNVTGTLHLGHALTVTLQDVLARWYRMKGVPVIWIPGLDHAGIATQAVVEKYLYKTQKVKKTDLGKEEFLKIVDKWRQEKSDSIDSQLKSLGASLDWIRQYFTMSQHHNKAVVEAFIMLDKRKLLFRNKTLVNWSTSLGSVLSDIEVEFEKVTGKKDLEVPGYNKKVTFGQIYEIAYKLKDSNHILKVATTRPETIMGDVALAVHPNDDRYCQFIGMQVEHPLKGTFMPVIADSNVKMDFGTGVVKITPAHDKFDYDIAINHKLPLINVISEDGTLTDEARQYKGLPKFSAKNKILTDLVNSKSLLSVKDHEMLIPRCSRTGDIIELVLKEQWFIDCKDMAAKAYEAVEKGSLKLDPSFHNQTWFDWLHSSTTRNWCVSRQLWWGHKIPAYYCTVNNEKKWVIEASKSKAFDVLALTYGPNIQVYQDSDVLDTWFSSALLPFSCLGWPTKASEFHKYYPLSLMETGHDILFFWVARMIMLGVELTGKLPFNEVLLHGVLCDAQGKKMSKSRGNVILPENVVNGISHENLNKQTKNNHELGILNESEMKQTLTMNVKAFPNGIPECGVDALRFTLCSHNIKERTISFNIIECQQNKFFCNKIWQAARYILLVTDDKPIQVPEVFSTMDNWILSRLALMVEIVNHQLEQKNFSKAVSAMKEFIYYELCDYYMEGTKPGFKSQQIDIISSHRYTLALCLEVSLRILAPIMPYLCEELYSKLTKKLSNFEFKNSIFEKSYPNVKDFKNYRNTTLDSKMKDIIKVILSIRTLLGTINKRECVEAHIVVNKSEDKNLYRENINIVKAVSKLMNIEIFEMDTYEPYKNSICDTMLQDCSVYLVINDEIIFTTAKERIEKKRLKTKKKLESLMKHLSEKKHHLKVSDEESSKDEEKINSLQEEMKKIPITTK